MTKVLATECFGPRELGRILGAMGLVTTFSGSAGVFLAGYLRTRMGSYLIPFLTVAVVSLLGLVSLRFVRPLTRPSDAAR
jgi:MFS family permease